MMRTKCACASESTIASREQAALQAAELTQVKLQLKETQRWLDEQLLQGNSMQSYPQEVEPASNSTSTRVTRLQLDSNSSLDLGSQRGSPRSQRGSPVSMLTSVDELGETHTQNQAIGEGVPPVMPTVTGSAS